ncbi:putative ferric-chelate reductase 1 homolog [Diorhabda sublineata]|uniref:putative ferric-chelate reductase 1 homolog n=1 Tax=Diorhabda sublineata TaxID=1163346 RepID=UPI0024E1733C|nr:putative ferric-chelate reductase 1 homolog [Diorhabda sublineata]XP_056640679.1 putative ferric-chelate reductase 1 homolog [Diorhabda sublineata]
MNVLFLLVLIYSTQALPDGAPTSVCDTMTPFHGSGIPFQRSLPPYAVVTRLQNDVVQVSIGSALGIQFQGFMVQGRTLDGDILGTFQLPGGIPAHTIDCNRAGDTVTHNKANKTDQLDFIWVPPAGYEGDVVFNSTIAQDYSHFWVGITSPPVRIRRRSVSVDSFYEGCGVTKYCYGAPIDCVFNENCKVAVAVTSVGDAFDFELKANGNPVWVGVGLSDDAKMGDDSVVECVKDNGRISAFMSWTGTNPYRATRLDDPQQGIILLNASSKGDELYCKVRRNTVTNIKGNVFDLRRNSFHVLVASGSELKPNSVGFHNLEFLASPDPQVLSPNSQTLFNENPQVDTTTPPYFSPPATNAASTEFDPFYEGCDYYKLCFGHPRGCEKTRNCKAVTAITVTGDKYDFEMKADGNAGWVGVGLSDDSKMGDDSVIECVKDGNRLRTYMSWTNNRPYGATRLNNPQLGIELLNSSMIDDSIYCKVRRNVVTNVNGVIFDLARDSYHVLVASGSQVKQNGVGYHDLVFSASGDKRALSDTSEVKAASKLLIHLHGAFMLVAWIGTTSIGVLLARYFRQTWVGSTLMGKDIWFAWHRIFMVSTWLLTMAAFVIIFVELKAWSLEKNPHAILGTVTTILCLFQPIGAYFRPHPGTTYRPLFNWAHWLAGNAAHIIGIVAIFFAVRLTKAELPEEVDYILVAYVIVHVVTHLILSLLYCVSEKSSDSRVSSFPMKDLGGTGRNSLYNERSLDARFSSSRKVILGLYIVIIVILVVALVLITIYAPKWPFVNA